jgi:hypothetical protein
MESNGKFVTESGQRVNHQSGVSALVILTSSNPSRRLLSIANNLGRNGYEQSTFPLPPCAPVHQLPTL